MAIKEKYTIDASGKSLGRVASQVAVILRGKNKPGFRPYLNKNYQVVVFNTDNIRLTGNKLIQKKYYRHSGYLGGLREIEMSKVFKKDSGEVLRKAVYGMLPKNRLRAKMIKRLKMHKGEIEK